jgi:hypothetical protein
MLFFLTILYLIGKMLCMRRIFSKLILSILVFILVFGTISPVYAQKVIEEKMTAGCKSKIGAQVNLFGSFNDIVNPQANLPFVPKECGTDVEGKTTAIPVKYFTYVILRVYKFLISLSFYLFALALITLGVTIQYSSINGDYNYISKTKAQFRNAFTGLVMVLFAYYIVYFILWIFNVDQFILNTKLIQ